MSHPMVIPIHDTVPGRVWFQVPGRYRAEPQCRMRFKTRFGAFAGSQHTGASTLTGHLPLKHCPQG